MGFEWNRPFLTNSFCGGAENIRLPRDHRSAAAREMQLTCQIEDALHAGLTA